MAAKQIEVLKWLEEVVDPSEITPFEKSETNIDKLHQLMVLYKAATKDAEEVKDFVDLKTEDYENQANLLESKLEKLQLTSNVLSTEDQDCLKAYSSLCSSLNLTSISPSNVILALSSLEEDHSKVKEDLRKEKRLTDSLLHLSKGISQNTEVLKKVSEDAKDLAASQEQEILRGEKRQSFNKEKLKKYQTDIKSYEVKLNKSGFTEEITFKEISKNIQEITKLRDELEDKKKTLESYTLPPDVILAEVKVEEMRQTLSQMMTQMVHDYTNKKK